MPILSSRAAPEFFVMTTSDAASDDKVGIMTINGFHDDVIKWIHFPRNWPFVRKIHRSPVNFPYKGQWRGALMFSLIYVWINDWANNREAGDLRRQHGHYDVIVMFCVYIEKKISGMYTSSLTPSASISIIWMNKHWTIWVHTSKSVRKVRYYDIFDREDSPKLRFRRKQASLPLVFISCH